MTKKICVNCETDEICTRKEWAEGWGNAVFFDNDPHAGEWCAECMSEAHKIEKGTNAHWENDVESNPTRMAEWKREFGE